MIKKFFFLCLLTFGIATHSFANNGLGIPENQMRLPVGFDADKLAESMAKSFENFIEEHQLNSPDAPIPENEALYRSFPDLDIALEQQRENLTPDYQAAIDSPQPPGNFIEDVILKLGSGNYSEKVNEVRQIIQSAIEVGNILQGLAGGDLITLPAALLKSKKFGNVTVSIVLADIKLYPTFSRVTMYAELLLPQRNAGKPVRLTFGGYAEFSFTGGIVGNAVLGLLADCAFEMPGSNRKVAVKLNKYVPPTIAENNYGMVPDSAIYLSSGTFVLFNCDGFKEMGVSADIYFSRDWLLPVTVNTAGEYVIDDDPTSLVNAHFEVYVQDWNNLLVSNIAIDTFVLKKWDKMTFAVGGANVDLSDYRNPSTLEFPQGYINPPNGTLWRGVFIDYIEITLPQPFKKACEGYANLDLESLAPMKNAVAYHPPIENHELFDLGINQTGTNGSDQFQFTASDFLNEEEELYPLEEVPAVDLATCRIEIEVNKLLIDETGVSGFFEIGGQAPLLAGGVMDKAWSWSLDSIKIQLIQSDIVAFDFGGSIVIPIAKENTPFGYTGGASFIPDANGGETTETYYFEIILGGKRKFPLWKAVDITLYEGSSLNITVTNGEFVPTANLSGLMVFGEPDDHQGGGGGSSFQAPAVEFRYLILTTQGPYLDIGEDGYIALTQPGATVSNFPISIDYLSLSKIGADEAKLSACITVNLMGDGDGGLAGTGCFSIWSKLEVNANGAHRWRYNGVTFDGATIELDFPPVYAYGTLNIFENDSIYGNGFSAFLHAEIELSEAALEVDVGAVFGRKDGFRYWMFDAYAEITTPGPAPGIPLAPSPLFLNGFGGGMFWHMRPYAALPLGEAQPPPGVVSDASGILYKPSLDTGLGLKFALGLTSGTGLLTGKLSCIIRFSPNFGLQNITFWGEVEYIVPTDAGAITELVSFQDNIDDAIKPENEVIEDSAASTQAPPPNTVIGRIGLSLDFERATFHAFAEVKINFPDAGVTGYGAVDILIDPGLGAADARWHMYIGGYNDGSVEVPSFFNPDASISLFPVGIQLDLLGTTLQADLYFLTGNDIPGPPPIHPEAAAYFEEPVSENGNRAGLNVCGRNAASGTGIAFGASMFFEFRKKIKVKVLFVKVTILDVKVRGGVGFDISLLKYHKNTVCDSGYGPQGLNGFRATGRVWAFVSAQGRVLVVPIPPIGIGLKFEADLPKPSYFDCVVVINFIKKFRFGVELGDECGPPCDNL